MLRFAFLIYWAVQMFFGSAQAQSSAIPTSAPPALFAATAAIGLPQPLTLGIQVHSLTQPALDVFYEGGFFKFPLSSSTRSGSDYTFEAGLRYHPFLNWFYVGSELGFRHVGVNVDISNLKQDGVALANTATLSLGTFFAGILVGGEWRVTSRVALAFDLGIQIALIHTGGITINADPSQIDGTDNSVDDQRELKRISGLPLPQIAILRGIWYL